MQLAIYYNRCIQNDWTLSNDHNKIRQIFLKKEGIEYHAFSNCRPISITSVIYKTLENVILKKMKIEEYKKNVGKLNHNQIGF